MDQEQSPTTPEDHPNRNVVDRRLGLDRRQNRDPAYDGPERRLGSRRTGLERRRGAGIRREEDRRSAEEGEMTAGQYEFVRAIELYKKVNKKLFPTWTEVLEVVEQLGYRKTQPRTIDMPGVPDPVVGEGSKEEHGSEHAKTRDGKAA